VYLTRIEARGFRSLRDTRIELRPTVTVLVGENNGGKTNVIDAVLLLTDPLEDGRARRWWTPADLSTGHEGSATLTAPYGDLSDAEDGTHLQARVTGLAGDRQRRAQYTVTYTPPSADRRSSRPVWSAGGRDGDPEARRAIRHVYLPPLRDAQQELSSGSGQACGSSSARRSAGRTRSHSSSGSMPRPFAPSRAGRRSPQRWRTSTRRWPI
jgi:putative ATP-dependent endonuclease of OLD family